MADTGLITTGTGANNTGIGTIAWSNPTNIQVVSSSRATSAVTKNGITNYLFATNFDFSAIPDGSTIDGIYVSAPVSDGGANTNREHTIKLIVGGSVAGSNKAAAVSWNPGSSGGSGPHTTRTWGGASDLWGLTPSAAEVKASNFGLAIAVTNTALGTYTLGVHYVQMQIYYTEPEGNAGAFFALFNVKDRIREILKAKKRFWLPEPVFT